MTVRQADDARIMLLTAVPEIVTEYAPMRAVLALAQRAAASDSAVLITGEAGTGKGLIARALHRWSARSDAPLGEAHCARAPARVIEHELFGDGGGVHAHRGGLLERAAGGTIVLHQIGALDRRAQGMLLRVLAHGEHHDARGARDVRIIASSTDDLAGRVASGTFEPALLGRISAVRIVLPPLRERTTDIRPLAEHFLHSADGRRHTLSEEAIEALERYRWPGNVRELRHVIQRAALVAPDGIIRAAHLALPRAREATDVTPAGDGLVSLEEVERRHIQMILERVDWHQGRAATILGISPKTLYRKMRGYGFRRPARPARRPEREHTA